MGPSSPSSKHLDWQVQVIQETEVRLALGCLGDSPRQVYCPLSPEGMMFTYQRIIGTCTDIARILPRYREGVAISRRLRLIS